MLSGRSVRVPFVSRETDGVATIPNRRAPDDRLMYFQYKNDVSSDDLA